MKDNDNLITERPTFVTHLECAMESDHYPADQVHNLSKAGKPMLVRYDLAGVKKALTKDALAQRPADMWRYRELLPVRNCKDIVSLGEDQGLVKVIFDKKTGQLLGAHMIGAEVTELIQGYVVAMNLETTEEELMHTVFPHPTLSEMMKEAVLDAYGRVLNM